METFKGKQKTSFHAHFQLGTVFFLYCPTLLGPLHQTLCSTQNHLHFATLPFSFGKMNNFCQLSIQTLRNRFLEEEVSC